MQEIQGGYICINNLMILFHSLKEGKDRVDIQGMKLHMLEEGMR